MLKYLVIGFLLTGFLSESVIAQRPFQKKRAPGKRPIVIDQDSGQEQGNQRNDVEGTIWEFKIKDRKEKDPSKQTTMTGRLRIKQTSVFAVSKVATKQAMNANKQQAAKTGNAELKTQLKGLLSQKIGKASEQDLGGKRVGNYSKGSSNKNVFRFDEDDDYPLSGYAELKPDTKKKGGVMIGNYYEYVGGKKGERWYIEMRKVED